jgi:LysR family transcriptional regulator, nitrogen assimilation regulatory protein
MGDCDQVEKRLFLLFHIKFFDRQKMISLRQIRSFVAVYEASSFTGAAEREGATQSGISQHIKQLEAELGVSLLARNGRAVAPTQAGRLYYAECVDVLKRLDAAQQGVAVKALHGKVRVGLMPTFTRSVLAPALDEFLAATPEAEISVIEAYSGVLTEMVLGGELDFAVVPAFEGTTGLSQHLVIRDREMLVSSKQRCDDHLRPVRLRDRDALKIILPGTQNTRRRTIETYLGTNDVRVAQRLELDAMMGTLQFVAGSDWVAVLPFVMMMSDLDGDRFSIRPLDDPPFHSEFVLIEPSRRALSPAAARFAAVLKAEAQRADSVFRQRVLAKPAAMAVPKRRRLPLTTNG